MVAIFLDKLRKQFGQVTAVKDISVEFEDGKLTSVLGPSGCGKTTTLNLIAGFIAPDRGAISFGSRTVADPMHGVAVPSHRRELGMVFQSYALWPHLSVAENVGYGLKMRGVQRAERDATVRRALARVRLEKMFDRFPHELSGGQQQRVALARAIAYSPQILLFDEPLSNLDAQLREEMRDELKALHEEIGVTAVYVTHDQSEAMSLSDEVIVMGDGEILQKGTPRQLYDEPAEIRVARFIGKTSLIDAELVAREGSRARVRIDGVADPIQCRSGSVGVNVPGILSVRPEAISLSAAPSAGGDLRGQVLSVVYLGDVCRYDVALPSGQQLLVQQSPVNALSKGDEVAVSIDPEQCYFIAGREGVH
ncbi:MAG: ABC transporter ATP-binding protein [Rhizobiaceae bacterium]|nr:ABC transporter ATP-binding protein [Rhizobiaceae bacterium]